MILALTFNCLTHRSSLRAISKRLPAGQAPAIASSSGSILTRRFNRSMLPPMFKVQLHGRIFAGRVGHPPSNRINTDRKVIHSFLLPFLLLAWALNASAEETNLITFTNSTGEVFDHIKVVKSDKDGIIYTVTRGVGGGRLKYDQMPEEIASRFHSPEPEPKLQSLGASSEPLDPKLASCFVTNETSRMMFSFQPVDNASGKDGFMFSAYWKRAERLSVSNDVPARITADGKKSIFKSVWPEKLTADEDGNYSQCMLYQCSLEDLTRMAYSDPCTIELAGSLGAEKYVLHESRELKGFVDYWNLVNPSAKPSISEPSQMNLRVIQAAAKIIDQSENYVTWTWKVDFSADRNYYERSLEFQFLDANGFMVDYAFEYPIDIKPGSQLSITKTKTMKKSLAARVKSWKAVVK